MKSLLLTTAAVAVLTWAAPASAANVAIALQNGLDIQAATGTGTVTVGPESLLGVTTSAAFGLNTPDRLSGGVINIDNTTAFEQTLEFVIAGNGYTGHATQFKVSATLGVTGGSADLTGAFFVDAANVLGASSGTDAPGLNISNFTTGLLSGPQSFSFNGIGFDNVTGPFSMAEQLTLKLSPGASVFVEGSAITAAVPEARTWVMMALGFALMAGVGWHKGRTPRLAA